MNTRAFSINDIDHIKKQITDSVTRNILKFTGLEESDIVYDTEHLSEQHQPDSTVGEKRGLSFGATEKAIVTIEETRDPINRFERGIGRFSEVPFYIDNQLNAIASPSEVRYDFSLTIKYRSPSKTKASQWCSNINRCIDGGGTVFSTNATYHYAIPFGALNLLAAIYRASEAKVPSENTLTDYLNATLKDSVTLVSNMGKQAGDYAVRNTVNRLTGPITIDDPVERKSDSEIGWVGELTFKFTCPVPETVLVNYPTIINNTLLDTKYWPSQTVPGMSNEVGVTKSATADMVDKVTTPRPMITLPLFIPECDFTTYELPGQEIGEHQLVVCHMAFNNAGNGIHHLLNLLEIDGVLFADEVIQYIKDSYSLDPLGSCSLFRITLLEDEYGYMPDKTAIDANQLAAYFNGDIDLKKRYRTIISLKTHPTFLRLEGIELLSNSPIFMALMLNQFYPLILTEHQDIMDELAYADEYDRRIKPKIFNKILDLITESNSHIGKGKVNIMKTVYNNGIIALRS